MANEFSHLQGPVISGAAGQAAGMQFAQMRQQRLDKQREEQLTNIYRTTGQQAGGDPVKHAELLTQAGYPDLADKVRANSLGMQSKQTENYSSAIDYLSKKARLVGDQGSWSGFRGTMEQMGIIGKGELPDEYNAQAQELVKRMRMGKPSNRGYQFIPTDQGIMRGDLAQGTLEFPPGQRLMPPQYSPNVKQGVALAEARGRGQGALEYEAPTKYAGKVGTETGEADAKLHETAISASDQIQKIDQLINHLKTSDAITGMGAETLKNIERFKVFVSDSKKAGKKVSDTEILDAMMGSEVFPLIGALGIGARGMDTPAEREFMRSVMTGSVPLNKNTLIRMAETRKQIAERAINRFNDRVDKGEMDNYFKSSGRTKEKIQTGIRAQRSKNTVTQGQPPLTNSRGWQLMSDGQNMAYVGPNGEVEEVK